MENNNPMEQPTEPVMPAPQPTNLVPPVQPESGNKMVLWFVLGIVVIVLVVGGIYFYLNRQQGDTSQVTQPTKTPVAEENLENELSTIDVADIEQDFAPVDQDLQNL